MKKLHQFHVGGGNAGHSNIEVHDIQFVVCKVYKDAIPVFKSLGIWRSRIGVKVRLYI